MPPMWAYEEEMIRMEREIYVLQKEGNWTAIKEKNLDKWLADGSISEGDRVVYPELVMIGKSTVKMIKLEKKPNS